MLDAEFIRQRAQMVRELAQITTDPFIKQRLIKLRDTNMVVSSLALD